MFIINVVLASCLLESMQLLSHTLPVSDDQATCIPLKDCAHINNLIQTRRNDFGTMNLLVLVHCSVRDGQIYVKCISPSKTKDFMDGANVIPNWDNCGLESLQSKIAHGETTGLDEYPWIALLKYHNSNNEPSYGCHGNLINMRYVLTAAHCVDPEIVMNIRKFTLHSVVLGEYDVRNKTDCIYTLGVKDCADDIQELRVESYYIHPDYTNKTFAADIALIRMERDAMKTDYVRPICLPTINLIPPFNETLWIAGWGTTEQDVMNDVKVKARFKLRERSTCHVATNLTSKQFCAASVNDAKTCPGDSGGPLMMRRSITEVHRLFLVGVDSLGVTCNGDRKLSIYTNVASYIEWIVATMYK